MKYFIYIKSHCEMPDYEDEVEARSKDEATDYFLRRLNAPIYDFENDKVYGGDWSKDMIQNDIVSEEEMNGTLLQ